MRVPIDALMPGNSPRMDGESKSHTELMASASELPPIVVHRPTMRVIDGMHRLRAAKLRGRETIQVRFFDGTADEAFVIAVSANVTHGMPLTRKDRKAAAAQIIRAYPSWSDRLIASTTGLSHRTVAEIRRCASGQIDQLNDRVGKDGRVRPITTAIGRRIAAELIKADESASLREVAKMAGISPSTVRDVRSRLQRGAEPVPVRDNGDQTDQHNGTASAPRRDAKERKTAPTALMPRRNPGSPSPDTALRQLRVNPALKFTDHGRALIRLLTTNLAAPADCGSLIDDAPEHCLATIAELASAIGDAWYILASDCRTRSLCG
ncbi:ParB N-terminal domain-containing protein [Mycobacterium sp. E3247]|uniref:ParB/RepB/Spo0J family partition protein n=1 Tax=Mycobacterium sp. E3247 TaxID=1856864 RepID=UPI0012EA0BC1